MTRGMTMMQAQLREYVRYCCHPQPGRTVGLRRRAVGLVVHHLGRRTPARWRPDILDAHGLPRFARAVDAIRSH